MPKNPPDSPTSDSRNICTTCGRKVEQSMRSHMMKVHQSQCTLKYAGAVRVTVSRHKDGTWHCPHCPATFPGYPMDLQGHVKQDHSREAGKTGPAVKAERKDSQEANSEPSSDGLVYPEDNDTSQEEDAPEDVVSSSQPSSPRKPSSSRYPRSQNTRITRSQRPSKPSTSVQSPRSLRSSVNPKNEASSSPAVSRVKPRIPAFLTPSASSRSSTATSAPPTPSHPPVSLSSVPPALPGLPPALDAFFNSLRVPLHHLGDIFVNYGFDSEETLNLLCELAPEAGWAQMRSEIEQRSKLSGWLAIQLGLQERAKHLASKKARV